MEIKPLIDPMEGTKPPRLPAQYVQCHGISYGFHLKLQRTGACLSVPMDVCLQAPTLAGSDLCLGLSSLPRNEL